MDNGWIADEQEVLWITYIYTHMQLIKYIRHYNEFDISAVNSLLG